MLELVIIGGLGLVIIACSCGICARWGANPRPILPIGCRSLGGTPQSPAHPGRPSRSFHQALNTSLVTG